MLHVVTVVTCIGYTKKLSLMMENQVIQWLLQLVSPGPLIIVKIVSYILYSTNVKLMVNHVTVTKKFDHTAVSNI